MSEELRCIGCGAILQDQNEKKEGYLPTKPLQIALKDPDQEIYCQRCFRLRHYNEIMPVAANNNDFLKILNTLTNKKALIVNVVDLFDFNDSLLASLKRFAGQDDFILVANKFDLFPKNLRQSKIKDWLRQEANKIGLRPQKIFLVSAQKKTNLDELIAYLNKASRKEDVYFVGTSNVGKSTLLNAIIDEAGNLSDLVTTSHFPGTTLDQIKLPLDNGHFLIDTPGILNNDQLINHLSAADLKAVLPKKPLKPATYQLQAGNTLFISGLARIDLLKSDKPKTSFTVYTARSMYVHRCQTKNAADFYQRQIGKLLVPPVDSHLPKLAGREFKVSTKSDLLFAGTSFVTVPAGCLVKAYTPGEVGLGIRRALI